MKEPIRVWLARKVLPKGFSVKRNPVRRQGATRRKRVELAASQAEKAVPEGTKGE